MRVRRHLNVVREVEEIAAAQSGHFTRPKRRRPELKTSILKEPSSMNRSIALGTASTVQRAQVTTTIRIFE